MISGLKKVSLNKMDGSSEENAGVILGMCGLSKL